MMQDVQYSIRDAHGNVYGPASIELLRQWIGEGRVAAGMFIAPEGTTQWMEVSTHPALADLFGAAAVQRVTTAPSPAPALSPQPIDLSYHYPRARQHPMAVVSLITGVISLCSCCCMLLFPVGIILSLTAVVTGIMTVRDVRARPDDYTGLPLAVIGIVCGSIELLLQLLFWGGALINLLINMKH
ncbi:MAG: DUF4190 domain-containing protein [Phycisphaerae bacterium]